MKRREFLSLVATLGAGAWPLLLRAEPVNGKVGYLHPITISPTHVTFALLQREWRRLGYVAFLSDWRVVSNCCRG